MSDDFMERLAIWYSVVFVVLQVGLILNVPFGFVEVYPTTPLYLVL